MNGAASAASLARGDAADQFLSDGYLVDLVSYSLADLDREANSLKDQSEAIQQETQNTATKSYAGFIQAASCFLQVSGKVQDARDQLHALKESLYNLQSQASVLATAAQHHQVRAVTPHAHVKGGMPSERWHTS